MAESAILDAAVLGPRHAARRPHEVIRAVGPAEQMRIAKGTASPPPAAMEDPAPTDGAEMIPVVTVRQAQAVAAALAHLDEVSKEVVAGVWPTSAVEQEHLCRSQHARDQAQVIHRTSSMASTGPPS